MNESKYRARKHKGKEIGRYVCAEDLQIYTGLGRASADTLARKAGARKKIGKRVIYDLDAIDKYIEAQV